MTLTVALETFSVFIIEKIKNTLENHIQFVDSMFELSLLIYAHLCVN